MTRRWHIRRAKIQREAEGYLELGMPEQALQTLGRLGDPAGFESHALYLWGEGLRTMQRYFEALLPLERAAKAAPDDIRVRIALGWCYKRTGRLDLAIDALEQALIVEPELALLALQPGLLSEPGRPEAAGAPLSLASADARPGLSGIGRGRIRLRPPASRSRVSSAVWRGEGIGGGIRVRVQWSGKRNKGGPGEPRLPLCASLTPIPDPCS